MSTQVVVGIPRSAALDVLFETSWHPDKTRCCDHDVGPSTRFCPYCGESVSTKYLNLRTGILLPNATVPNTSYYNDGRIPIGDIPTLDFVTIRLLQQVVFALKYDPARGSAYDWVASNTHAAYIILVPAGGIQFGPWNLSGPFQRGVLGKLKNAMRILPDDTSPDMPLGLIRNIGL